MKINEAAAKAVKQGAMIRRRSFPKGDICVLPTNTEHGCLVIQRKGRPKAQWAPTLADLCATDWETEGGAPESEVGTDETAGVLEPERKPGKRGAAD